MLADKLNMTPEEAERWIVNLIRNARLDAKIDSKLVRLLCAGIQTSTLPLCCSQKPAVNSPSVLFFFLNVSFRVTW